MKTSKVTIRLENSDGTHSEFTTQMPYEVAENIQIRAIEWESIYWSSVENVKKFIESLDEKNCNK